MQSVFKSALVPPGPVCFGLRLQPLTLGHCFILARAGSPFILEGNLKDGFISVFICSQHWRESEKDIRKFWFPAFCWLWGWRCRKMNLAEESKRFIQYYQDSVKQVVVKEKQGASFRSMAAPWFVRMQAVLMAEFHFTRDQALDTLVLEATSLIYTLHEAKGNVHLWSDDDEDFWEWSAEQDRLRQANKN